MSGGGSPDRWCSRSMFWVIGPGAGPAGATPRTCGPPRWASSRPSPATPPPSPATPPPSGASTRRARLARHHFWKSTVRFRAHTPPAIGANAVSTRVRSYRSPTDSSPWSQPPRHLSSEHRPSYRLSCWPRDRPSGCTTRRAAKALRIAMRRPSGRDSATDSSMSFSSSATFREPVIAPPKRAISARGHSADAAVHYPF